MKPRLNQVGQAATEYILLLVLSVAIMMAVGDKLFKPLKKWTDFYLGTYTACLLDYGVLPESKGTNVSECQTMAANSGMANGPSGGGSSGGDSSEADDAKKSAAAAERARAQSASKRRNGRTGNQQIVDSNGREVNFGGKSRGIGDNSSGDSNSSVVSTNQDPGKFGRGRTKRVSEKKISARAIIGAGGEDAEKLLIQGQARVTKADSELPGRPLKRMPFKPAPLRTTASSEEAETSFSIGNLFRLGIMAIIIVAIVYVVGTQLNSVSKSMED